MNLPLKFLCFLTATNFVLVQGKILNKKLSNNYIYKQVVYSDFSSTENELSNVTGNRTTAPEPTEEAKLRERAQENSSNCSLPASLITEIQSYTNVSNLIIHTLTNGIFKGKTYKELRMLKHTINKFALRRD